MKNTEIKIEKKEKKEKLPEENIIFARTLSEQHWGWAERELCRSGKMIIIAQEFYGLNIGAPAPPQWIYYVTRSGMSSSTGYRHIRNNINGKEYKVKIKLPSPTRCQAKTKKNKRCKKKCYSDYCSIHYLDKTRTSTDPSISPPSSPYIN